MREAGSVSIDQKHSEHFVVDMTLDERSGFGQYFVEVQRSIDFLANFGKGRQYLWVF
jgi:hypothetical protein